jgi:glycosyltransferase involved in cell wall biosynthesis
MKNKEIREELGRSARKTALERFSLDIMLDKTLDLYNEVVHAR